MTLYQAHNTQPQNITGCAGGEYYFDKRERQLYYVSNETNGQPPADGELEAVVAESLVIVRGSQAAPVRNVTLANISIQDTTATFLTPHENPSGDTCLGGLFLLQPCIRVLMNEVQS